MNVIIITSLFDEIMVVNVIVKNVIIITHLIKQIVIVNVIITTHY
jgi:hypothetical protein